MKWDDFRQLAQWFGVPGAMLAVLLFALVKGWLLTGREVHDRERLVEARLADAIKQMASLQKDYEERLLRVRDERTYWREMALDGMRQLERAADTVDTAVRKLPKARTATRENNGE